jgi:phosphoenolpyruvate carboxykinase (ATP)
LLDVKYRLFRNEGVFNIEGGCYAKCVGLDKDKEPEIFNAIRFGSVVENIRFYEDSDREVNFDDISITPNTRVSYPLEYIPGAKIPAVGGHPKNIIFLTCDANGVLPPVAKLTIEQSMYHFISGYTANMAGVVAGDDTTSATFSACFGEVFLMRHPTLYAEMLEEKIKKHNTNVWLLNTGWINGKFGEGSVNLFNA